MAGAGFKTFGVGDVLTASDVNTYLMQQAVMNFADSGARGSAIGTATEGMVSYLADTDAVEVYDGSAWVGVGADPGLLQVVTDTKTDTQSSSVASGATVAVSGLSASITPSSNTNKVLVLCDIQGAAEVDAGFSVIVKRGGTAIGVGAAAGSRTSVTAGGGNAIGSVLEAVSLHILDSPATTSSVTYTVELLNNRGLTMTLYVNRPQSDSDAAQVPRGMSRLTLIEVAS